MRCNKEDMLLYAITDRSWTGKMTLYEQIHSALENGATCIQLREKELDYHSFLKEAEEISDMCNKYGVPFIINDNVDIAVACKATGVHVGQEDMNVRDVRNRVGDNMVIGVSAHTVEEALDAVKNGADYLGLGAVFSTSTKTDADIMPFETLKAICDAVEIPTVAIGGISINNIMQLAGSGIDGVAVVSAIFGAEDPGAATAALAKAAKELIST